MNEYIIHPPPVMLWKYERERKRTRRPPLSAIIDFHELLSKAGTAEKKSVLYHVLTVEGRPLYLLCNKSLRRIHGKFFFFILLSHFSFFASRLVAMNK